MRHTNRAALLLFGAFLGCAAPAAEPPRVPVATPVIEAPAPTPSLEEAPVSSSNQAPKTSEATVSETPAILGERGDLPLVTLDGQNVKLTAYGAKVTVISIWGTFCVPCLKELPYVDALYKATKGDPDVSVLTVVVDDYRDPVKVQTTKDIVARLGLSVPVLFDRDIRLYRRLNGEDGPTGKKHTGITVPQLVLIDPTFSVRRTLGFKTKRPIEDFVREQQALIDLARRGRMPAEEPLPTSGAPPLTASL